MLMCSIIVVFCVKQKTAYEMRISDWSSDVCCSDLDEALPGYFVAPTVFGAVTPDMTIAREEIFGPVLSVMPYRREEDAIAIANDTPYGLSAYVDRKRVG